MNSSPIVSKHVSGYFSPLSVTPKPYHLEIADKIFSSKWTATALIITSIALFAISITSIALLASLEITSCSLLFGLIAGVVIPFWPAIGTALGGLGAFHFSQKMRRMARLVESTKDAVLKLKDYEMSVKSGPKTPLPGKYEIGMALMLEGVKETNIRLGDEKFNKGFKILEKTARHFICKDWPSYRRGFSHNPKLKSELKKQINNAVAQQKSIGELIKRCWSQILKDAL